MNDQDLITEVLDSFNDVRSGTPVERIVTRGRAVRARRRIPRLAAGLTVAAAAAFAVTALLPGHPASRHPGLQLAAWTVVKHADGTVHVTIRELRDPSGLQRTLRADGVPASVIFGDVSVEPNPCQSYGGGPGLLRKVVTPSTAPGQPRGNAILMAIRPSALPDGAGVQIITNLSSVGFHLVITSHGCTGS